MTITFYRFSDNISVQVRALIYEQIVRGRNISTLPTDSHWILNHWILKNIIHRKFNVPSKLQENY